MTNKVSQAVLFGYLCTCWLIFGYGIYQFISGESLSGEYTASIVMMIALLPGILDMRQKFKAETSKAPIQTHSPWVHQLTGHDSVTGSCF